MAPIIITINTITITALKKNLRMRKSNPSIILLLRAQRGNLNSYDEAKTTTSQYYCHCERKYLSACPPE
jgi:hypothetical protein